MKSRVLVVFVAFALNATLAFGQADPQYKVEFRIGSDLNASTCELQVASPGIINVDVFQTGLGPTTGLLFAAYIDDCFPGAVWLDDELAKPWMTVGSTQDPGGISIGYGQCVPLPLYVGHIAIQVTGGSPECCPFRPTHPWGHSYFNAPVLATDCTFKEWEGTGSGITVNPGPVCSCVTLTPVESTSWGRVKALYR